LPQVFSGIDLIIQRRVITSFCFMVPFPEFFEIKRKPLYGIVLQNPLSEHGTSLSPPPKEVRSVRVSVSKHPAKKKVCSVSVHGKMQTKCESRPF